MNVVNVLENAKKIWDLSHTVGGNIVNNKAGDYYLIVQQKGVGI